MVVASCRSLVVVAVIAVVLLPAVVVSIYIIYYSFRNLVVLYLNTKDGGIKSLLIIPPCSYILFDLNS